MKFTSLLFLIILTSITNQKRSEINCSDFKIGEFELVNVEFNQKYIIKRERDSQTEQTYNLETGEKIGNDKFFKIKWVSECEYNLLIDTIRSKYDETDLFINSKGGLSSKILKIENNCASIITSLENKKLEGKLCKIK